MIIPVGGGGLISGMAIALKEARPSIRVIGVQAEGCPAAADSWRAGSVVAALQAKTIADGIAVKKPSPRTLHYLRKYVDEMVTVADGEVSALGHEFLVLDGDGRIVSDHQFPVLM